MSTGSISVLVSLISAVSTFLKFGEAKTTHEAATNAWLNLYTEITGQLGLRRELRVEAGEFIQNILQKYSHLFELSPIVKQTFITKVKKKIKKNNNQFRTPIYLNGISPTRTYREDEEFSDNSV